MGTYARKDFAVFDCEDRNVNRDVVSFEQVELEMNQFRPGALKRELEPVHASIGQPVVGQVFWSRVRRRAPRRFRLIQRQDVRLVIRSPPDSLSQFDFVRLTPTVVRFGFDRRGRG